MSNSLLHVRTFIIGSLGGLVGYWLNLPLGWLLGAMVASIPFAMSGVAMPSSMRLRAIMIGVIGVMVGGAFTPDLLVQARQWAFSLGAVGLYTAICALVGIWFCRTIGRQDRATAAFSAMPGGLSEILVLGPSLGADIRTLSLTHGTRLFVILLSIPFAVTFAVSAIATDTAPMDRSLDFAIAMPLSDAAILLACLAIGMVGAKRLRLPAAHLTGPLILSAIVHLAGWTDSHPPQIVIVIAQIVIGASVAKFFAGMAMRELAGGVAIGFVMTAFMLVLALAFALGFQHWLGIPFLTGYLALVPGGLPEMSLVAISLGIDPAFVSIHHLFRVLLVLFLSPVLVPLWLARKGG